MALSTFVKINSITNLTDARYGAGMNVNLLGFNLNSNSEKYISPSVFKEISGWLSGVDYVGEFGYESSTAILETLKEYPTITWIECEQIEELKSLVGKGYSILYKINLEELRKIEPDVAEELKQSGIIFHVVSQEDTLSEDDLEVLKNLSEKCNVLLGTGINVHSLRNLLDNTGIYGISLSGSDEIKPGLKDMDELAEILELLEIEE